MPLGEVARRLGHSVETLVSTYVGAMEADEELGNVRIELVLNDERSPGEPVNLVRRRAGRYTGS